MHFTLPTQRYESNEDEQIQQKVDTMTSGWRKKEKTSP